MSAIKTDGTLWTWGGNNIGQLGTNNLTSRSSPGTTVGGGTNWCTVNAGISSMAVKSDGTLWTWGSNACGVLETGTIVSRSSPGTVAGGGTTWRTTYAGVCHSLADKTDGTLWTWGNNCSGQLGSSSQTARSSPGTTTGAGTNWCNMDTGSLFTGGVKSDGTLWMWGQNSCGNIGDNTTTFRTSPVNITTGACAWCYISLGAWHTAGIGNIPT